jgi:hypothetical protein
VPEEKKLVRWDMGRPNYFWASSPCFVGALISIFHKIEIGSHDMGWA